MKLSNIVFAVLLFSAFTKTAFAAEGACVGELELKGINSELYAMAVQGSAASQYKLGLLFEYGRGVAQNDATARCWYERSALQHNGDAQYRLAVLFDNGWGIDPDKTRAFENYKYASANGHVMAQHDLAMMYFYGTGTQRNVVEAYRWLKHANLSGNELMQKHLKMVASEMSSSEIYMAEHMAALDIAAKGTNEQGI